MSKHSRTRIYKLKLLYGGPPTAPFGVAVYCGAVENVSEHFSGKALKEVLNMAADFIEKDQLGKKPAPSEERESTGERE